MLKYLLTVTLSVFYVLSIQAQFNNMGLEDWESHSTGLFEEPSGPWATANTIALITGSQDAVTTFKSTDAVEGTYSARIRTGNLGTILTSGTVTLGVFEANQANPAQSLVAGQPYTDRPETFKTWFKYAPISGDSCDVYAFVSKWNTTTNKRDTLGTAWYRSDAVVADWTELELDFVYTSTETPDSLAIVYASSAGGSDFLGSIGSELFADGAAILLTNGILQPMMPEIMVNSYPNPAKDLIRFELSEFSRTTELRVLDVVGNQIEQINVFNQNSLDVSSYAQGMYYFQVLNEGNISYTGNFSVRK